MADKKNPMRLFEEQPDVRFFGLRLVKFVSVIFGSVFFFTLAVTLLDTSALDWKLNVDGLKFFFLDAMKVPGSILAFYLAVLGLIGANHRSEQTKRQIEEARVQNDFSNYYKHREEFFKYVDGINKNGHFITSSMTTFHQTLYPDSRNRNFSVSRKQIRRLDRYINLFVRSVPLLFDQDKHESALYNLNEVKAMILKRFHLRYETALQVHTSLGENDPWGDGSSLELHNFISEFVDIIRSVDTLFKFDPDYRLSLKMRVLFQTEWLVVDEIDFDEPEDSGIDAYKNVCLGIEKIKPTNVNHN
ncbi:hypothetical protein [Vibrio sp. EA2]|uniref:hypothetical protein n=1 Tax=Vibrio sp. EA2 TaxID=3079860 RepID=UPI002949A5AF|nr:hypothetical protein [Vibrio sp. EA2]MDV6251655.1 hypothetical protein [Vibrio sp. EA2]